MVKVDVVKLLEARKASRHVLAQSLMTWNLLKLNGAVKQTWVGKK